MENFIRQILKEETSNRGEKYERKIISSLIKLGFNSGSTYREILPILNNYFGISGVNAFEMFQLFKDNWRTVDSGDELIRTDVSKTKVRTSNYKARELVSNRIPFKGSNTIAEYVNGFYVVYSYNWYPIFVYKDGQWFENENRYSVSTAKQMSQLRPHNQGEIIKVSKEELEKIIYR